jgi:hypothetical protein
MASVQESLMAAAKEYERKWNALAPSEQRAFLRSALSRIVIDEDKIAFVPSTSRLRGWRRHHDTLHVASTNS